MVGKGHNSEIQFVKSSKKKKKFVKFPTFIIYYIKKNVYVYIC